MVRGWCYEILYYHRFVVLVGGCIDAIQSHWEASDFLTDSTRYSIHIIHLTGIECNGVYSI